MEQKSKECKTLYFEGAGCFSDSFGEPRNCRIRTALTANDGIRWYVELHGWKQSKEWHKAHQGYDPAECVGWVDCCIQITEDKTTPTVRHPIHRKRNFPWTYEAILTIVNEELGCSFDRVEVLPNLAGYRVFKEHKTEGTDWHNYGDVFVFDPETTAEAERIEARELQRQKDLGEKSPCLSVWRDENDLMILHVLHFRQGLGSFTVKLDG